MTVLSIGGKSILTLVSLVFLPRTDVWDSEEGHLVLVSVLLYEVCFMLSMEHPSKLWILSVVQTLHLKQEVIVKTIQRYWRRGLSHSFGQIGPNLCQDASKDLISSMTTEQQENLIKSAKKKQNKQLSKMRLTLC